MLRSFANLSISSGSRCLSTSANKKSSLSPRAPLRPTYSPYNLFLKEQFNKFKTHDKETVTEVMRKVANAWKDVSPAEKEKLAVQAKKLVEERKKAVEALSDQEKLQIRENHLKKKERALHKEEKIKYEDRPKRPASAYGLFLKENAAKAPRIDGNKLNLKELASEWETLEKGQKQKYRDESASKMAQYNKEVVEWRAKHGLKKG